MKLKDINILLGSNYKSFKEFENKVDWDNISICQKLSENFITEFKDKVDWKSILPKYGYKMEICKIRIKINKYQKSIIQKLQIKSDNYCSGLLDLPEFIDLALRLITLKAFQ